MYIFFHSNKSTYDCFIVTTINTRSTEFKMAESDSHNMSVSLLAKGSIDFFQESQEFLIDSYPLPVQNSIAEHPLNLKTSTPKLVLPKLRLMCEDFIEDSKTDENTIDSDATPDLDLQHFVSVIKMTPVSLHIFILLKILIIVRVHMWILTHVMCWIVTFPTQVHITKRQKTQIVVNI